MLYKRLRAVLDGLSEVVASARDIDAVSFFERLDEPKQVGFKDRGACSGQVIGTPGPKEAGSNAHLHIEERYSSQTHELEYYRYEICWSCDVVLPAPAGDYLRDSMIALRRGVRFDHHPSIRDENHPLYHWHPNGCSEFRLSTGKMTPLKVAAVAAYMFDRSMLDEAKPAVKSVVSELKREMLGIDKLV